MSSVRGFEQATARNALARFHFEPIRSVQKHPTTWLRASLARKNVELICPHRRSRRKAPLQDGRALRRYRKRYKIERSFAWPFNHRRLVTRYEYYDHLFEGFVQLACLFIILKGF